MKLRYVFALTAALAAVFTLFMARPAKKIDIDWDKIPKVVGVVESVETRVENGQEAQFISIRFTKDGESKLSTYKFPSASRKYQVGERVQMGKVEIDLAD